MRKFFYLFTCEYCFSHYVAARRAGHGLSTAAAGLARRVLAWFTLVWIANIYMSLFGRLRLDIKRERVEIKLEEEESKREDEAAGKPAVAPDAAADVRFERDRRSPDR